MSEEEIMSTWQIDDPATALRIRLGVSAPAPRCMECRHGFNGSKHVTLGAPWCDKRDTNPRTVFASAYYCNLFQDKEPNPCPELPSPPST